MSKKRDKPSDSNDTKKSKHKNPPNVNEDNFSNNLNKNKAETIKIEFSDIYS